MKNEILIQTRQRYWYDRCLELAGARLVMFGTEERTTETDLENAIGPNTAAVHYYAVEQSHDPDALSLEQTIAIAHAHGVLVTVDAAGTDLPAGKLRQVRAYGRRLFSVSPPNTWARRNQRVWPWALPR